MLAALLPAQMCLLPPVLRTLHSREHHISPHRGQHGKFEPSLWQLAHDVLTRNLEASSRASRIGRRLLWLILGEEDLECMGVTGPADEGAVEKYSDSEYVEGVRQMEGMGDMGDVALLASESESDPAVLRCLAAVARSRSKGSLSRRLGTTLSEWKRGRACLAPPSRWCRCCRGQLVGENEPIVSSVSVARDKTGATGGNRLCERETVRIGDGLVAVLECSAVEEARARSVVAYKFAGTVADAVADRVLECLDRRACTALGDDGRLSFVEQVGKRTASPSIVLCS